MMEAGIRLAETEQYRQDGPGLLEQAASETAGYPLEVQGSGRTDGGVHAKGQTASVILRGKVQESEFLQNMNRLLPLDIRVTEMELVKNGFHARLSAVGKCYEYWIDMREKPDVFMRSIPIIIRKS